MKSFNNGFSFDEVPWAIYKKQKKNQVFKLLPIREEGGSWEEQIEAILIELGGISDLENDIQTSKAIEIMAKLSGLKQLKDKNDISFMRYRKIVFETLSLIEEW